MKQRYRALPFFLLAGFLCPCSNSIARDSKYSEVSKPGWHKKDMDVADLQRWYRLYVPITLKKKPPVVMLLHGGTQSMRKIFRRRAGGTRAWVSLADTHGFLLLVPNGTNPETGDAKGDKQSWNDLRPAGLKHDSQADDVRFLQQLLEWAHINYFTDLRRVYVTGASNGGMMTYRLLVEKPELFAAGAAFIATLPKKGKLLRQPHRPVPIMIMNGTNDPLVKWEGGAVTGRGGDQMSSEETVAWWVQANRANRRNVTVEQLPDLDPEDGCRISKIYYPSGPEAAPVVFYRVDGGGHAMPSRKHDIPNNRIIRRLIGNPCKDVEGAALAWEFMKGHALPTNKPIDTIGEQ